MTTALLYTELGSSASVTDGGFVPFGTVVRQCGNGITLNGANSVLLCGCGDFYLVNVDLNILAESDSSITFTMLQDGMPVTQRTITVAGTSEETLLSASVIVRNKCEKSSNLTMTISGQAVTVDNLSFNAIKVAG